MSSTCIMNFLSRKLRYVLPNRLLSIGMPTFTHKYQKAGIMSAPMIVPFNGWSFSSGREPQDQQDQAMSECRHEKRKRIQEKISPFEHPARYVERNYGRVIHQENIQKRQVRQKNQCAE